MKFFSTLSVIFLLTACQSALVQTETSYLEVTSQASIEITESLEVYPDSARAFLQNGEVISSAKLDWYRVNCEVEINTVSESRQIIKPEKFNIIAVAQKESPIVMSKPLMLASLVYADSTPPDIKRFYHFRLSAQQAGSTSQVRALICRGALSEPYQAELPTLEEMQAATGSYIKFNL